MGKKTCSKPPTSNGMCVEHLILDAVPKTRFFLCHMNQTMDHKSIQPKCTRRSIQHFYSIFAPAYHSLENNFPPSELPPGSLAIGFNLFQPMGIIVPNLATIFETTNQYPLVN